MPCCPKCHQLVDTQATSCPHCRNILKAYGHPGITLHRASGDESLCNSCTYHEDDSCTFPKRPYAKECTLYNDKSKPQLEANPLDNVSPHQRVRLWCQRNQGLLMLLGLAIASLMITLKATSK